MPSETSQGFFLHHLPRFALLHDFLPGATVLQLDPQHGFNARLLADLGAKRIIGITPPSEELPPTTTPVKLEEGCSTIAAHPAHLPFPARSFDIVFAFESLTDTNDLHAIFDELKRVLAPSGFVVVAVPSAARDDLRQMAGMGPARAEQQSPSEVYSALSEQFEHITTLTQSPFFGQTLLEVRAEGGPKPFTISYDLLKGQAETPLFYTFLASNLEIVLEEDQLIQLPFSYLADRVQGGLRLCHQSLADKNAALKMMQREVERARSKAAREREGAQRTKTILNRQLGRLDIISAGFDAIMQEAAASTELREGLRRLRERLNDLITSAAEAHLEEEDQGPRAKSSLSEEESRLLAEGLRGTPISERLRQVESAPVGRLDRASLAASSSRPTEIPPDPVFLTDTEPFLLPGPASLETELRQDLAQLNARMLDRDAEAHQVHAWREELLQEAIRLEGQAREDLRGHHTTHQLRQAAMEGWQALIDLLRAPIPGDEGDDKTPVSSILDDGVLPEDEVARALAQSENTEPTVEVVEAELITRDPNLAGDLPTLEEKLEELHTANVALQHQTSRLAQEKAELEQQNAELEQQVSALGGGKVSAREANEVDDTRAMTKGGAGDLQKPAGSAIEPSIEPGPGDEGRVQRHRDIDPVHPKVEQLIAWEETLGSLEGELIAREEQLAEQARTLATRRAEAQRRLESAESSEASVGRKLEALEALERQTQTRSDELSALLASREAELGALELRQGELESQLRKARLEKEDLLDRLAALPRQGDDATAALERQRLTAETAREAFEVERIAVLEALRNEHEERQRALEQERAALRPTLETEAATARAALQQELDSAQAALAVAEANVAELQSKQEIAEQAQTAASEAEATIAGLRSKLEEAESAQIDLDAKIQALYRQRETLEAAAQEAREQAAAQTQAAAEVDVLRQEAEDTRAQLERAESELQLLREKAAEANELDQSLTDVQSQLAEQQNATTDLMDARQAVEQRCTELEAQVAERDEEIERLKAEVQRAWKRSLSEGGEASSASPELEEDVVDSGIEDEATDGNGDERIKSLRKELASRETLLNRLQKELDLKSTHNRNLQEIIGKQREDLDKIKGKIREAIEYIGRLHQANQAKEQELDSLRKRLSNPAK